MSLLNNRSHVPRQVGLPYVPPRRVESERVAPDCQGLGGTLAESFDKGDGAGWDADQTWDAFPGGLASFFANVVTLDSAASVSRASSCSGAGLFSRTAIAMIPEPFLIPNQTVSVTFVSFTPSWTGGNEYTNRLDVYARVCEISGDEAFYSGGFIGIGSSPLAVIQKRGGGGGETLASTTSTLSPGDVVSLEADGNSLTLKVNGSTVLSASGTGVSTGGALNPECSSAGLGLGIACVDVTAPGQGPFGGAGGWSTIKADDFSVVASA